MANIANGFNDFFVNIGPELAARIPNHGTIESNLIKHNPLSLFLSATDEQEVINIVLKCKSKSSTDCDNIDMYLVKK